MALTRVEYERMYTIIPLSIVIAFIGALFFDYLVHGHLGGFTFYGGLVSGAIVFLIFLRIYNLNIYKFLNLLIPSVIIGHAVGRIGCFLAGCCYGKPTDSLLGVIFPAGSLSSLKYGMGTRVHPTQLYESVFLFLLFIVIIKLVPFYKRFGIYLTGYGLFRFLIEFLRGDNRGIIFNQEFFFTIPVYKYFTNVGRYYLFK